MAKIKSIEYFRVLPRWLFVKVCDEEGNSGWGESTLEGHSEAVEGTLNALIKRYVGYEAEGGAVFMSAISGIDIALWDLKARKLKVPIYQLLGGKVRNQVRVYAWIGGDRPSEGFTAIKMNATADVDWLDSPRALDSSLERLKAVKALGLDVALDFHGRLHKPMAKQLARLLEPYSPLFIEEPLLSEHPESVVQLSNLITTPIALGERLYNRWDVKRFLQDASIDVLQPDISHVGGISEIKKVSAMAEAYDIAIAPHCPLGPIALAASIQVALSTPNFAIQEMSLGIHYNTEAGEHDLHSYVNDASVFNVTNGHVKAPVGVGLGIEINENLVRSVSKLAHPWLPKEFYGTDGSIREW
ncbi:hypothetical protein GP486_007691 [Trichoglossum hirsutum]|uniref:Mandelate racemase/muconate lactonizing enzyme C-terminal domain-containing protein n=1 Tax=Trichoglossum hirsutum TaxID=265104 RepID=A0A9P8IF19_9PEZI|nr:hypothetical protein GP486_007691 [Trichoglossum hirsutum]